MKTQKIRVCKSFTFDSAHFLPRHQGKCQNLHGHTYKLEVEVSGILNTEGPSSGMVVDFGTLKEEIERGVISLLDHTCLNEIVATPTAENLVINIKETIVLLDIGRLERVRLWETPTSYAEWRREDNGRK